MTNFNPLTWLDRADRRRDEARGEKPGTSAKRRRKTWEFYWTDHGWLRSFWRNEAEIAPGVWRANQPSPAHLARYKARGITTILNLRGFSRHSHYQFEAQACRRLGLKLEAMPFRARNLVDRQLYLDLLDLFETIEHPFLMHCKSGADRTGLAAALYLMHIKGVPVEVAKKQLTLRFTHVKSFQTGILDFLLDAYEADTAAEPMPIRQWFETRYDRRALKAAFRKARGQGRKNG